MHGTAGLSDDLHQSTPEKRKEKRRKYSKKPRHKPTTQKFAIFYLGGRSEVDCRKNTNLNNCNKTNKLQILNGSV